MKESFRQSMAWLHTWAGLFLGWLLFAMFATGTSAYFQEEITRWMEPEITGSADPAQSAEAAVRYLQAVAPDARIWFITPPSSRAATTKVFWQPDGERRSRRGDTSATLDANGDKVEARATRGGYFLYRFHYDLHYMPVIWARYLVGIAAMFMLVAILSGIVTHKKIFADFFMLRFGKGQRSWLDAHNVTAVIALPFYLMITFTGLVTLATLYMPWGITANYANEDKFFETVFAQPADVERSGRAVPLAPVAPMMRAASAAWDGADVGFLRVTNPGDATATVTLTRSAEGAIGARGETLTLDAAGRPLGAGPQKGAALQAESVMVGLHAGRFAEWGLRWLYFLSGIGGTIMVGSGLILWTVKRRARLPDPDRPHFGFRLVERLNVAAIAGLGAGFACYFLANRLLPLRMADRANWEINSLFLAWGAMLLWAIARPARRAWIEGLCATALLFAAVPVVNALTTPRNLFASLVAGDWLFVAFDGMMLLLAAGFGWAARKVARRQAGAMPRRAPRNLEATVAS